MNSFLIGVKTEKSVVIASDRNYFMHGILTVHHDHDKSYRLGEKLVMMCFGEGGDAEQFGEYIAKNLQLYKMRNGYELGPKAAAHFIRRNIAESLRTRDSYFVHLVLGGYDETANKPYLCAMDYLGTIFENPYIMQGIGGRFSYALMDRIYSPSWSEQEAVEGIKKCVQEVHKRLFVNYGNYQVQVIDEHGIRKLDNILQN